MRCLTLVSWFSRILKSDNSRMGRFLDVVRWVISVRHFIKCQAFFPSVPPRALSDCLQGVGELGKCPFKWNVVR